MLKYPSGRFVLNLVVYFRTHCRNNCYAGPKIASRSDSNLRTADIKRKVPKTASEYQEQKVQTPIQPKNARFLRVAILGHPNAGKSTLTNRLTGWRVCSVSSKVHTTRHNAQTVLNISNTQIEFTDTPGTVSALKHAKHNLEPTILNDPINCSHTADLLAIVVDASDPNFRDCLSPETLKILYNHKDKPSILILNKIDAIRKKEVLLDIANRLCNGVVQGQPYANKQTLRIRKDADLRKALLMKMEKVCDPEQAKTPSTGWSEFSKLFMISALKDEGLDSVLKYFIEAARFGAWQYHPSVVINQSPKELGIMVLREKLLDEFSEDIGYKIKLKIHAWEIDESGALEIIMGIGCLRTSLLKKVIGPKGATIASLAEKVTQELSNVFHCEVVVKLVVSIQNKS